MFIKLYNTNLVMKILDIFEENNQIVMTIDTQERGENITVTMDKDINSVRLLMIFERDQQMKEAEVFRIRHQFAINGKQS